MVRRAAAVKGTRRPRKPSPPSSAGGGEDGAAEDARPQAPAKRSAAAGGFFCCYLLRSLCPRLKGRTYIGFTVNPRRRIRQHNGEISSGAWRTRRGRPWEMVLCIYGFPTNVSALQFEWAWQHPKESLAVRNAAASFKSLSGAGNKMKLAYAMLNLPSWENLNLTVNFFSSTSTKFAAGCPPLPSQMKTVVCPMEDLQCHAEAIREDHGPSSQENDINEDSQGHQGPDSLHRVEHSWNQQSSGQMQPMEAQTRTADYDVEEYDYSSDDFALMERDGILDLTEPDRSRTSPQCSLSSNSDDGHSSQEDNINEGHQARQGPPDCPRGDGHSEDSWKQLSADQVQRMDAQTSTAVYDVEEDNYSSGEFVPIERDGILDLTEPDRSRILPQCSLSSNSDDGHSSQEDNINEEPQARQGPPDCPRGDGHSKDSWKQSSNDQVQQMDMQTSTAVYDVEEDNYSSDEFVPMERDVVLDLTEPDGSRTLPQCSLSSDNDYGGVVQDELGQVSPLWKVRVSLADGGDGGDVHDELRQTSPVWKACAGSDGGVVDRELGQASPVLKVGTTYSDCGGSGFTDDELGRASPMLMVDAGSEEGERDVVVDLVTPIPVGRLRRRAGTGSICHRIIDLTASPVIIEL